MEFFFLAYGTSFMIDLVVGDPRWLPHPVRLIGAVAKRCESICRTLLPSQFTAGVLTVMLSLFFTAAIAAAVLKGSFAIHHYLYVLIAVLLLAMSVASRDLVVHSKRVFYALTDENDIEKARYRLSWIVGRDTRELDQDDIIKATVETVSENYIDGIASPIFYGLLASCLGTTFVSSLGFAVLGAYLYKTVNTLDSMFGYKNEKYLYFGKASAYLDDFANFLPARFGAMILVFSSFTCRLDYKNAFRILLRDRLNHTSPNAGHPEAAAAGALGIKLGGSSKYGDMIIDKPTIGNNTRQPVPRHITEVNRLILVASFQFFALCLLGRFAYYRVIQL